MTVGRWFSLLPVNGILLPSEGENAMNGIQVKNLVKTYTTQSTDIILNGAKRPSTTRTVLHGVSVDFPAGKLTAILGRSGAGARRAGSRRS